MVDVTAPFCRVFLMQSVKSRSHPATSNNGKTNFGAFLKYGTGSDIVVVGESLSLCSSVASKSSKSSLPVQYLSKPQFSPFFGFSEGEQQYKGVEYRIWRYEV